MTLRSIERRYGHWLVVAMIVACALAAACSKHASEDALAESSAVGGAKKGGKDKVKRGRDVPDAEVPGAEVPGAEVPGGGAGQGNAADGATEPNFKVAFIGDTASGDGFRSVLQLVRDEGAQLLVVQGDLTYGGERAGDWFPAIDDEINRAAPGSPAAVTIPYFAAKGNHDDDWGNLGKGLKTRMGQWGITPEHNDPTAINYSVVYKGLKMVMVADDETNPTRENYVRARLQDDKHIWKICSWHKNQRASNVGPKSDEMGWSIYETCRANGAIVAQGHSHTYSRSKTLTNDLSQTVDPSCDDPFELCAGPGKHFFFDSSLGGSDMRSLEKSVASKPYWGAKYTGDFGALFIEFHVDGDPRKARGYFKTVGGVVVDPSPESGRTSFDITSTN